MADSWAESAISFFRTGGHNHDGVNSSLIDLSKYSIDDINALRKLLGIKNPEDILNGNPNFPDGAIIHGTFIGPKSGVPGISPAAVCKANPSAPGCDPSGIYLATGVLFDSKTGETQVYIDVAWGAPDPANVHTIRAVGYEIEIVESGAGATLAPLRTSIDVTTCRFIPVRPGVTYGIRIRVIDNMGWLSDYLPPVGSTPPHDYAYITAAVDNTPPAKVTGVKLFAGFGSAIASWDDNADADVAHGAGTYHVQLATDSAFTAIVYDIKVGGTVATFTKLTTATEYWVRVKAIDTSNNESVDWSDTTSDTHKTTVNLTALDANMAIGGANLLLNSSFELDGTTASGGTDPPDGNPDNWTKYGTNTWAFDTGTKFNQTQSIKVTYSNDLRLISQNVTLSANAGAGHYTLSAWIYIPSSWTGGAISITDDGTYGGASIVDSSHASTTVKDTWTRIWIVLSIVSGDLIGTFMLRAASATASQYLFIDACQFEVGDFPTAYAPTPAEIFPNTIKETNIADNAVTTPKLIAGAVVANKIAANTITASQIAAHTITATEIYGHTITAAEIAAGTITATEIAANTITAGKIVAGTITSNEIATNTITANNLSVTQNFTAHTLTISSSGVLRTGTASSPYNYIIMDANGLRFFQGGSAPFTGGSNTAWFDVVTGTITLAGDLSASTMTSGTLTGVLIETDFPNNQRAAMTGTGIEFFTGTSGETHGVIWTDPNYNSAVGTQLYINSPYRSGNAAAQIRLIESNTSWGRTIYPLVHVAGSDFRVDGNADIVGNIAANAIASANNISATSFDGPSGAAGVLNSEGGTNKVKFGWTGGGSPHFRVYVDGTQQLDFVGGGSSKTFIIDHPMFPMTKYLVHGTIEGPENAVIYRGESRVNNGYVIVYLPPYFEKLTQLQGRTVQITPIYNGETFTNYQLAASEVRNGKFYVYAENKNLSQNFFWQVMAVRKDVPDLIVEPGRDEVEVRGDGPYKYYRVK